MKFRENRIYIILFTFVFSFVLIAALSLANRFTAEKIRTNMLLMERKSILSAMNIAFTTDREAHDVYEKDIREVKHNGHRYFLTGDGAVVATIFSGNGLWGTITGVIAVKSDLSGITGLGILSHSETPGLGGRIEEEWYRRQFRGEKLDGGRIKVDLRSSGKGNYDHEDGTIDTITGATRTSEYMEANINAALRRLAEYTGAAK